MSNFEFLRPFYPTIFEKMKIAESRVYTEPKSAALYTRLALEETVHLIFEEEQLEFPYDTNLANLLRQDNFKDVVPSEYNEGLYIVRKTGNAGAHYGHKVSGKEALVSIKHLFGFLKWFTNIYAPTEPELPGSFDSSFIPKIGSEQRAIKDLKEQAEREQEKLERELEALRQQLANQLQEAKRSEAAFNQYEKEQEKLKFELSQQKQERETKIPLEYTEKETRKHLIDLALREAGWDHLQEGRDLEFPIKGMPISNQNPKGNGFIDYVLWGDDGLPLALIEAKRSNKDSNLGKSQAWLYANCLEKMVGRRPIIFYSNGYKTYIWDDAFYSVPRRVHGFYTKEELEWTIQKRSTRKDLRKAEINKDIAGRPYQLEGIKRVAESFVVNEYQNHKLRGSKRHALMVMATGSGKTRVSAAIVDLLTKNNWVKRVLFLADRNALVTQAKNAFAEFLPDLSAIDLTQEKENNTTRLVFSTYQSIINKIDGVKNEDGRFYGVGHFDLIIVDEAHRSVYNKYGVIFEYFDSLLLGLTATPKKEIDHNTYDLFECTDGNPTFAYELEDAVRNKYLVSHKNFNVSTAYLREGLKYRDLSPEEKERFEEEFQDEATGLFPEEISSSAFNRWLFNKDTIYKILDELMEKGLKIEGGDKIGRTIIFAANQKHADFIQKCFEERYPQFPSNFMAVIHNQKSHAQSMILSFCDHHNENLPQVAVSVDMMDTGIDAPRVLNLVFFKIVRSYSKFWQMIGRGTRLCPGVFGVNKDKEYFMIFDVCGNFEFFEENKEGTDGQSQMPVTQKIFITRLSVARLLLETGEDEDRQMAVEHIDHLHTSISSLDLERFEVQMKREFVDEFIERDRWNRLNQESVHIIETQLSKLPIPESINEKARRFDLMMFLLMQARLLMQGSAGRYEGQLLGIAEELSKLYTIPQVLKSRTLIESLRDPDFYEELRQQKLEEIRREIRELVQYIEEKNRPIIETDFEDTLLTDPREPYVSPVTNELYKSQVERFVRAHKNHITISKLNTNKPITEQEVEELQLILFDGENRGTMEHYKEIYGDQPLGVFIRSIVGLDIRAAQEVFTDFLQSGNLTADQIKFIDNIITHLNRNGTIDKNLLFKPPFNNTNDQGLLGVFDDREAVHIIRILDGVNKNAQVV